MKKNQSDLNIVFFFFLLYGSKRNRNYHQCAAEILRIQVGANGD